MFKKTKKIIFVAHPFLKGHVKLADKSNEKFIRAYSHGTTLNSAQFEQLQEKMQPHNICVLWKM